MTRLFALGLSALLLALAAPAAHSKGGGDIPTSDYLRLLKASKIIESYQKSAAVSAQVFSARNQGSDKQFARFMGVVATADLSDVDGCMINMYKTQNFSQQDITYLISYFESPLGVKVLAQGLRVRIANIRTGRNDPLPQNIFTETEKHKLMEVTQNPSYQKYGMMVSSRNWAVGLVNCIGHSAAVKKAGIVF